MATTQDPLAATNGGSVKEKLSDAAAQLKNTASDYGRSAAENIDRNVHGAAGALQSTAEKIRSQAPADGGKVSGLAQTAASKLDSTAQALSHFDTREVVSQFEDWTRRNPGVALGGALAIGFFIGLTLNRDSQSKSYSY